MAYQLSTHDSQLLQQHFDTLAAQLHQTCTLGAHLLDATASSPHEVSKLNQAHTQELITETFTHQ